jgi:uncharacterized protein (TIGR02118 family)
MYRVTVCYGQPTDPAAFDTHYTQTHAPLVRQVPGLVGFTAGHGAALDGSEPPYYFMAALDFATEADFRAALRSPEMGAAGADVANFATGGATMISHPVDDLMGSAQ